LDGQGDVGRDENCAPTLFVEDVTGAWCHLGVKWYFDYEIGRHFGISGVKGTFLKHRLPYNSKIAHDMLVASIIEFASFLRQSPVVNHLLFTCTPLVNHL
jgi:hypothetical protein